MEKLMKENHYKNLDYSTLAENLLAQIQEIAREEYNCQQREERRKKKAEQLLRIQQYKINDPTLSEILRNEQIENVRQAIAQLLPEQQELIFLIHFQEVKASDIAKRDNVSPSAISKRLTRAEEKLKKLIA